jgi:hypothetical protein
MKKTILTSFAAITLAAFNAQAIPIAGSPGNYYEIVLSPGITWAAANSAANASTYGGMNGHLVTITSAPEDAFVLGLVLAANMDVAETYGGEFWAGGFQPSGETIATANWTWVNDEGPISGVNGGSTYSNWSNGEPNDTGGPGSEQFLGLGLRGYILPPTWNDEGNPSLIRGYVVEYNGVPDAGSSLVLLGGAFAMLGALGRKFRK